MTVGGNSEVVAAGETGLLVEKGDGLAFQRALSQLLENETRRRRMGEAARVRALERFDPQRSAQRVMALYEAQL